MAGLVPAKAPAPAPEKPSKKKTKAPPVLGFASLSGDPLLEEARQQHAAKRQRLEASESGDASLGDRLAEMDALARRHEAGLRADAARATPPTHPGGRARGRGRRRVAGESIGSGGALRRRPAHGHGFEED